MPSEFIKATGFKKKAKVVEESVESSDHEISSGSSDESSDEKEQMEEIKYTTIKTKHIVKYIYHLADIHIRLFARHAEYKEVFEELYKYLQNEYDKYGSSAIIVICGDILHSKSDLSSNCIDLASNFFDKLSNIMETFIIMGNHDVNSANKNHLDSLSPIINMLDKNTLHYFPISGVYNYGNISFIVTSVLNNNKVIKIDELDEDKLKKIKIGLYHGGVSGCVTDVGVRLNNNVTPDDFEDYDYVLLGDIHKYQYMNKDETIAYCGSLIGQNYGESTDKHGLIKWDLVKKTSEFVKIKNNYGFIKLYVEDGEINNAVVPKKPRIQLIIKDETKNNEVVKIIKKLKHDYEVQEIIQLHEFNVKNIDKKKDKIINNNSDLINYDNLIKDWFDDVYNEAKRKKNNIKSSMVNKIIDLNKEYLIEIEKSNKVDKDDEGELNINKSVNWELKRLIFSNMFSYGSNNIIEFNEKSIVYGIVAKNGHGKSSIVDIILFSLFDKCSRGDKEDIMNSNKNNFVCQIEFEIGSDRYYIQRYGERNTKTLSVQVKFWKIDKKGKMEDLSGADRNGTNRIISLHLGTYDDFVSSYVSTQNNHNSFIDLTQAKRREFLNKLLKIEIFQMLYDKANEKKKQISTNLKFIQKDYNVDDQDKLEDEYDALEEDKEKLEKLIENKSDKLKQLKKTKKELINNNSDDESEYANLSKLVLKNLLIEKKQGLEELNDNILSTKNIIKELEKIDDVHVLEKQKRKLISEKEILINDRARVKIFDLDEIADKNEQESKNALINEEEYKKLNKEYNYVCEYLKKNKENYNTYLELIENKSTSIELEYNQISEKYKSDKQIIDKLKKHEYDPDCEYCVKNSFVAAALKIKKEFVGIEKKYKDLKKKYDEYVQINKQIEKTKDDYDEYENMIKKKQLLHDRMICFIEKPISDNLDEMLEYINYGDTNTIINKYDFDIEDYNNQIDKMEKLINKVGKLDFNNEKLNKLKVESKLLNETIGEIKSHLDNSDDSTDDEDDSIDKVIKEIKDIEVILDKSEKSLNKIKINLAVEKNKLETMEKKKTQIDNLKTELLEYKIYSEAVSKEGVPNMLLKKFVPNVQNQVNEILATVCDFVIEIECKDKNIELYIIKNFKEDVEDDQKKYSVQTACGFEKSIINIAVRIVVSKLTCLSKPNIFVVDEMLSTMDDNNKNNISSLFEYLKTQFDIVIIISHLDEIKSSVDKIIQLSKQNNYSRVNNTTYTNLKNIFKLQFSSKTKIMANKVVDV
jgi:exonuclease SbcC